jgi:hypothetical protein
MRQRIERLDHWSLSHEEGRLPAYALSRSGEVSPKPEAEAERRPYECS